MQTRFHQKQYCPHCKNVAQIAKPKKLNPADLAIVLIISNISVLGLLKVFGLIK